MRDWRRTLIGCAAAALLALPGAAMAKTLVIGIQENLTGLDPSNANETSAQSASRLFYQGLYGFDQDMKLVPLLAESYTVSDDAKSYTFTLRQGVKFQDGTDFNAQAVKVSLERLANPENKLKRQSLLSMLDHVEVVDDHTVKVLLKEPFGALVNTLAHPGTMIISPAALEKYGKDIGRNPVGTGPFSFKSWSADTLEAVRYDGYWKGTPKVDGVTIRSVPENGSRMAMLQAGEAQFITPVPPEMVKVIKANATLEVTERPSIVNWYVALNTRKKPFDDVRVRQALNYAVDRTAFCKVVLSGFCEPADSPMPPTLKFYAKQGVWPYDPAKAKQLLADAGYGDGFEAVLWSGNSTTSIRATQFLQQQLAQIGVKAQVTPLESGVLSQKIWSVQTPDEATVQMYYGGWSSSTGDADWALRPLLWGKGFPPKLFNVAYYSNPEVDSALEAAVATADEGKRGEAYAKVQAQVWQDAPWIDLAVEHVLSAQTKDLSGVFVLPDRGFVVEDPAFQ
ncbi:glutathione ABC transporter substrate-binding protein [Inquilinus limosus]|uniref:Glutathione-binding protein GsiB n=1 Tax=Inquilinus limosus TaxID=171674 RepID=A0A211ZFK6_9PROT|nr:glutathione ABC transporter substrate-binding protein [Inquilinus limosus]OWJ63897.1 glutathione ABC transporter substrate-binding protein GsiB [Inquilinus limosus]